MDNFSLGLFAGFYVLAILAVTLREWETTVLPFRHGEKFYAAALAAIQEDTPVPRHYDIGQPGTMLGIAIERALDLGSVTEAQQDERQADLLEDIEKYRTATGEGLHPWLRLVSSLILQAAPVAIAMYAAPLPYAVNALALGLTVIAIAVMDISRRYMNSAVQKHLNAAPDQLADIMEAMAQRLQENVAAVNDRPVQLDEDDLDDKRILH